MRLLIVAILEVGALAATYGVVWVLQRLVRNRPLGATVAVFSGLVLGGSLGAVVALVAVSYWPQAEWAFWPIVVPILALVIVTVLREPLKQIFSRPTPPT